METKAVNSNNEASIRSLIKEISSIALPIALQSVLFSFVQLVDNLFIGGLEGSDTVKNGLNAINNVTFIIGTIVTGFVAGVGIYMAQASGRKDMDAFHTFFRIKLVWTLLLSFLLIGIALILFEPITSQWINKDNPETYRASLQAAKDYSLFIFPTLFIDYVAVTISSSFKSGKRIKITVMISFAALLINTSLNYPLIYTLGMGVKGSSLATMIARIGEFMLWMGYIVHKKPELIPKIYTWFNVTFKQLFSVFAKAALWTLNSFLTTLAFTIQIMFMSKSGEFAGAALLTAGVIAQLAFALSGGYSQALKIIILHRMGAGEKDLKKLSGKLSYISFAFGLIIGLALIALSPIVYVLYPNDGAFTNKQSMMMVMIIGATLWSALVKDVYASSLQGGGRTKPLLIMDSVFAWTVTLPLTVILTTVSVINMTIGWVYITVSLSGIIKPWLYKKYFDKTWTTLKPLVTEEATNVEQN